MAPFCYCDKMPKIIKLATSTSPAAFGSVVPQQTVVGVCDRGSDLAHHRKQEKEEQGGAGAAAAPPGRLRNQPPSTVLQNHFSIHRRAADWGLGPGTAQDPAMALTLMVGTLPATQTPIRRLCVHCKEHHTLTTEVTSSSPLKVTQVTETSRVLNPQSG